MFFLLKTCRFFFKTPKCHFSYLISHETGYKNPEYNEKNSQDNLWFTNLKQRVSKSLILPSNPQSELQMYNKALEKLGTSEGKSLGFQEKLEVLIFLGISSQRRFNFLKGQKAFMRLLNTFLQENRRVYNESLDLYKKSDFFARKLMPNLILSMGNLRVSDKGLLQVFAGFLKKYKSEVFRDYLYTVHTILALNWALMNYSNEDLKEIIKELNEYLWVHKDKLDTIGLLRFVWMNSYEKENFKRETLDLLLKNWGKKDFIFNYKNSANFLQIFLNLYPEVAQDFFLNVSYELLQQKLKDSNNEYLQYFQALYRISTIAKLITNINLQSQMTYIESQKGLSFFFNKKSISNKSMHFENKVCGTLDDLKVKYKRNVRLGIYEIDILLENGEVIVEINGDIHNIFEMEGGHVRRTKSLEFKLRHLKLWGVKRFAVINFTEWRLHDFKKEKREDFIRKIIEKTEEIV